MLPTTPSFPALLSVIPVETGIQNPEGRGRVALVRGVVACWWARIPPAGPRQAPTRDRPYGLVARDRPYGCVAREAPTVVWQGRPLWSCGKGRPYGSIPCGEDAHAARDALLTMSMDVGCAGRPPSQSSPADGGRGRRGRRRCVSRSFVASSRVGGRGFPPPGPARRPQGIAPTVLWQGIAPTVVWQGRPLRFLSGEAPAIPVGGGPYDSCRMTPLRIPDRGRERPLWEPGITGGWGELLSAGCLGLGWAAGSSVAGS